MTRQMIVAALICASGGLVAKTLTVDEKGGAEFTSIDAAVAVAEPGDTVRVMPGLYRETVVVRRGGKKDRPIVIESAVRGGAVVRDSEVWKNAWTPLDGQSAIARSRQCLQAWRDVPICQFVPLLHLSAVGAGLSPREHGIFDLLRGVEARLENRRG